MKTAFTSVILGQHILPIHLTPHHPVDIKAYGMTGSLLSIGGYLLFMVIMVCIFRSVTYVVM